MQCNYCSRSIYIAHVCPYCKEYHCQEHQEPADHGCSSSKQADLPPIDHDYTSKVSTKPRATLSRTGSIQNRFFHLVFTLVMVEEVLRLISYSYHSPYIESNTYVMAVSLLVTPYASSSIMFLLTCLILLATRRLAKGQNTKNEYRNLLKEIVPLGVFTAIAIIALVSIANRLVILLT